MKGYTGPYRWRTIDIVIASIIAVAWTSPPRRCETRLTRAQMMRPSMRR